MKQYFVYIMASKKNGTLYIGMTNNLARRVWQHKHDIQEGFTQKYQIHKLVYHESYDDVQTAIKREKQMKKWKRQWRINLIEQENSNWDDLFENF